MKIKRLGVSWGAMYEEAEPRRVIHGDVEFEFYVNSNGEIVILLPEYAKIDMLDMKFRVTLSPE